MKKREKVMYKHRGGGQTQALGQSVYSDINMGPLVSEPEKKNANLFLSHLSAIFCDQSYQRLNIYAQQ